ncbi:hypothetical protein COHA_001645 [Chlorella ohadii]|uniref:Kinesin-like protein n=1 Tax=Chlorella ohadii TaxID=2649997 RepID=A0AAD5DY88_9CHLO|nr:hypothetical protein COHA_001645 [Chlorella ohadii]
MAAAKPLSRANSAMGGAKGEEGVYANVQVILRCRPPSKEELAARTQQVVRCDEAMRAVTLMQQVPGSKAAQQTRTYHFDKVFPHDTTQEKLYGSAIASIVEEVLEGFNCTIFAYGQTGTGKTHTMTGDITEELSAGAGVIPRAIHQIFGYLDSINSEYTVKCSYLELYNEEITDLLAVGADVPKVRIMEDRGGTALAGIEESIVKSSKEIFALLEQGSAKRRTAETLLNKQSSRSHSVFIVTVSVREVTPEGDEVIRVGKLYLVDLAGSENITRSGAVEQRAKEAGNINKSLLTLGRVITALVEGQGHVPYRDSKLTRLLRDSLGGKTKTCIIATIAPTVLCQEETLSTLDYAHRAKNIKNKPEINARISKTTHLKEMNFEIEKLKQMLIATREKNGVYVPAQQYEEECEERRQLAARVEELETEAEAVAAQHDLDKQEWQAEMGRQQAAHDKAMGEVRTELAATQEELRQAQLAVQERDYAIATQQRCEATLAGHAGSLNDALAGAAADVALLFQRWDEKNALEDSNSALVQELRDAVVQRLAAIEAAVAGTAAAQAERFEGTKQLLKGFAERKAGEASKMQADMAALQQQLDGMGAAAAAATAALEQAGAAGLAGVGAQQAAYLAEAQAQAAASASQLAAAYAALSAATDAEQQQLSAFLGEQAAAGEAAAAASAAVVVAVREQLSAAKAAAAAAKAALSEKLGAQAAAVAAFEQSFLAKTQSEQGALLEQIAGMLSGFVAKAEQEVKAAEAAAAGLAADGAAGDSLGELTQAGAAAVAAFSGGQAAELAQLSGLVQRRVNEEYRSDGNRNKVPAERDIAVPAAAEIQALRAPPVDAVFAEFRAQLAPAAEGAGAGSEEEPEEDMPAAEEEAAAAGAEQGQQENAAGAANAPVVPPLDVSALPGPAKGPRVPSPSALGKRTRAAAAAAEGGEAPASGRGSPSKLRSAFQRHQQRSARGERAD